jgi:hypothetical protein
MDNNLGTTQMQPTLHAIRELTVQLHTYRMTIGQAKALDLVEAILLHLRKNLYCEDLNIPISWSARLYIENIYGYDLDEGQDAHKRCSEEDENFPE